MKIFKSRQDKTYTVESAGAGRWRITLSEETRESIAHKVGVDIYEISPIVTEVACSETALGGIIDALESIGATPGHTPDTQKPAS